MTKSKELLEEEEKALRNPQVEFDGQPNLAVQTGNKTISQIMDDFDRAGRAIQVARADGSMPEIKGLPAYPDPLETELLRREIDGELLVARKRLLEDQQKQVNAAIERAAKNEQELARIKLAGEASKTAPETTTDQ